MRTTMIVSVLMWGFGVGVGKESDSNVLNRVCPPTELVAIVSTRNYNLGIIV